MTKIGTALTNSATKVLFCGSGELGKEVVIEMQRLGIETIAVDRYPNAPAMQVAHRSHVINMLDKAELRRVIELEKPDYIVLDPPRDGIHPKALEKIIRYNVPQMVYISCKPTSLARDLEVLQARGYKVKKVQCVDMFPSTGNCETVCLLGR